MSEGAAETGPGGRRQRILISLMMLVIVGFVLYVAARWADDMAAPLANEGAASMTGTVTFEATEGSYRMVSYGASRPPTEQTECDITLADGRQLRTLGAGSDQVERFWTGRLDRFDAVAGTTTVTCRNRTLPSSTAGTFYVLRAGPERQLWIAGIGLGLVTLLALGTSIIGRLRRGRRPPPAPFARPSTAPASPPV